MKTIQSGLNLQLDKWNGSSHTCSPLDWPKKWLSPATCYRPHRLNKLATVKNGKPAVACYKYSFQQLPFKAPVDVLFQGQGKWPTLSRSEMLSSPRHCMQAQSLGCHTTDDVCGLWRGGVERGNAERSAFKIWAMVVVIIMNIRPTLELFQKKHWWNLWQTWWSAYGLSPVHGFHLNWPEVICCGNWEYLQSAQLFKFRAE